MLHLIASALSSGNLGAPNTIIISDNSSTGSNGKTAGIIIYNNGNFARYFAGVPNVTSSWLTPQSNFSQYEVRATLNSGDTPTGVLDTWSALSTSFSWTLETSVPEEVLACNITLEIRWTGNNVVQDSASYDIVAHGPFA